MTRLLLIVGAFLLNAPTLVSAHGVGQRIDLPIPLDLYLIGGAAVVALSFLAVWFLPPNFLRRFESFPTLPLTALQWLTTRSVHYVLKVLTLIFLVGAIAAGLFGVQNTAQNILPTTVWVIFAVGMTFWSAFFGNFWAVINPLVTLYDCAAWVGKRVNLIWQYRVWPALLGVFPAIGAFVLFRWLENVYPHGAEPQTLAWLVLGYLTYSLIGMSIYGKQQWLTHADPFTIFFSFLSRFAIIGVSEDKRLHLRLPGAGLFQSTPTTATTLFVLFMVAGVTADGFLDTALMSWIMDTFAAVPGVITQTVAILGLMAAIAGLYYGLSWFVTVLMPRVTTTAQFAQNFVLSMIPIAVGYEFAHYLSLLSLEVQRFIAQLSDPFGWGWNLLGTATWEINYTLINLKFLWNVQVGVIVFGHVLAVLVAHAVAERVFAKRDHVLISQYPLLIVMLLYTMLSLWIIAQPVVA